MFKMFHYMKERWYYIVMIVALLFVQAFCDLSLPDYTSKIINVGIQQKGVEDGVPETIREESMDKLLLFLEQEEAEEVLDAYKNKDGIYKLQSVTEEEREELNQILGIPELVVTGLSDEESEETKKIKEQMKLPKEADLFQVFQSMPKEQLETMTEEMKKELEEMPDSIVTQSAVLFVEQEYEAQDIDMDKLQMEYILMSGVKMLGLAFLAMAAAIAVTFLSARVAAVLGRNLRNSIYRKVISFSGRELNQFSTASLITRSTNDVQQVQMLFTLLFRIVLYAPILGIGGVYKVFQTDASMTWILALAVVVIMLFVVLLFRIAMPKFTRLQFLIDELNLVSREILTGVPVVRAFSREKHEEERFEEANARLTKTNLFVNRCMTFMMPVMMLLMNGVTVLIVWNGAHAVNEGSMQVGNMMAFMQYAMQIIMAFLMITMMSIMIPRANVAAKRINEVMETQVSIQDSQEVQSVQEDKKGQIVFDHVSFSYPGADEKTLHDIDFTARKGETVAFIGSTGSGKSTLVNLIPRFFDVTEGRILVDGVDIRNLKLHDLRERIGYVPQKAVLFSGTIDSNIRYGKEEATEAEVKRLPKLPRHGNLLKKKKMV